MKIVGKTIFVFVRLIAKLQCDADNEVIVMCCMQLKFSSFHSLQDPDLR